MKNKDADIELIERFIDGELSEKENQAFEKRISEDTEFAALYKFRKQLAEKWEEASNYENTKLRVGEIIKNEKRRKRSYIIYSLAASMILLIVVPGIIYYERQNRENKLAQSEEFQLQIDMPEYDATIRYFDENFKQEIPKSEQTFEYGKSISFKWNSDLDVRTAIVIKKSGSDSIFWRVPIPSKLKEYELEKELPKGEYAWQMEGFEGTKLFVIE